MEKVTESHVDMIIKVFLLRTDYHDYVRDWSEHLRKKVRSHHSTRIGGMDGSDTESDDSEEDIDLEQSVREVMAEDTLSKRKKFLFKFLEKKISQLKIQLSLETRTNKDEDKTKKRVKFGSALLAEENSSEAVFPQKLRKIFIRKG